MDTAETLSMIEGAVVAGLIVQLGFFSMFVVVTGWFHYKFRKHSATQPPDWQNFIKVIYAASVLVLIRSLFEMAEYVGGPKGELQAKEVYMYALEAVPMALLTIGFHFFHPSRFMPRLEKTMSASDSDSSFTFPLSRRGSKAGARAETIEMV
ncbi:hypothetical protein FLONG3_6657 [Fusarium longipes]|uniref:Uncharacterized protein n=1 Tax=Fusarium longipes TaxID=694270 RepID=A0A395SKQ3_9HYPO|nr:hypothetical protein FLONG3_6657 [Fusarium longipes]